MFVPDVFRAGITGHVNVVASCKLLVLVVPAGRGGVYVTDLLGSHVQVQRT